jgi:hypothetical protein
LYGVIFVKCPPRGFSIFSYLSFFVRLGSPFLRPDPHERYAGARRSGQGWRVSATARPVLDGSEHDGTVGVVGTTTSRGACVWCTKDRATSLYSAGAETRTHDAVMRIGSEAPRRRTHSAQRHEKPWFLSGPRHLEPSSVDLSQTVRTGARNRSGISERPPFSVRDEERSPRAPRHRARRATRR